LYLSIKTLHSDFLLLANDVPVTEHIATAKANANAINLLPFTMHLLNIMEIMITC
jgi:hypothetical protein